MGYFRLNQKVGCYKNLELTNHLVTAVKTVDGKHLAFVDGNWYDAVTGTSVDSVLSYITERLSDI